jgi:hypothetical protein
LIAEKMINDMQERGLLVPGPSNPIYMRHDSMADHFRDNSLRSGIYSTDRRGSDTYVESTQYTVGPYTGDQRRSQQYSTRQHSTRRYSRGIPVSEPVSSRPASQEIEWPATPPNLRGAPRYAKPVDGPPRSTTTMDQEGPSRHSTDGERDPFRPLTSGGDGQGEIPQPPLCAHGGDREAEPSGPQRIGSGEGSASIQ